MAPRAHPTPPVERHPRRRRVALWSGVVALAAAGVAAVLTLSASDATPSPDASPSVSPWPPTMYIPSNYGTVYEGAEGRGDGITLPAFQAAWYVCHLMEYKHEYWVFATMTMDDTFEHITIDQRSETWIAEEFFQHPIDTGVMGGPYDRSWIEEYLGHPLADGYFLWAAQACIMDYLDAPPSILDDMLATGPEDGERTATWGFYRATWTNDGDAGPDVVFSYEKPSDAS